MIHVDVGAIPENTFDCVVIVTEHARFDYAQLQRVGKTIVDTRNAIAQPSSKVIRLGAPRLIPERDLVVEGTTV